MSKMIYNGTMLPDIHTVYTDEIKVEYPYAVIIFYESENVYRLCVSSEPGYVYYFLKERIQMGDTYGKVDMDAGFSEWGELTFYTSETNAAVNGEATWFIWSNHDIYYPDDYSHNAALAGTLYLSASDPIPVGTITDPLSFAMGWQLGKRLRMRGRKPIGYSYNGTVLPELPELDKEKYPYAALAYVDITNGYWIFVCSPTPIILSECGTLENIDNAVPIIDTTLVDGVWGTPEVSENGMDYFPWVIAKWSNHDILNEDGTLYLAASTPVPVYE